MKKLMITALILAGVFGSSLSYAQDQDGMKTDKKEMKTKKKMRKGKMHKAMKKDEKMENKDNMGK